MNEKVLDEARRLMAGFFKNRRLELKLSQIEVAKSCGFTERTIRNFEQSNFWLGTEQLLKLCEALHLFPAFIEMEADDITAAALRSNWSPKPKVMTIDEALKLKGERHNRDGQHN